MAERTLEAAKNAALRRRRRCLPLHDRLWVCLPTPRREARPEAGGVLRVEWPLQPP